MNDIIISRRANKLERCGQGGKCQQKATVRLARVCPNGDMKSIDLCESHYEDWLERHPEISDAS